ncbi:peroxidase-like [Danaus plexippus]|uniref:peroxidase-like n=1 Tax=Danaus plexippus TaxID=13037 RepID=UPI002AB1B389|nr:peroxidase-like [Danaus plexippus]
MEIGLRSFLIISLVGFSLYSCLEPTYYDTYTGYVLSLEEVKGHIKRNSSEWCVSEVLPCNPQETRRLDGTCNNLKHPNRGASHTPTYRLLPAHYDKDFEPRKSKSGKPLPLCRKIRTSMLAEGRVPDTELTQLLLHFWVFVSSDVLSLHDTVNYILWKPYCCQERGKTDKGCIPNIIPEDDPVHRFSSIRCMNLTRPWSYQSTGCYRNDTTPERIITASPAYDLSHVYGLSLKLINEKHRSFKNGMLKFEVENNMIWPPSTKTPVNLCLLNQKPKETRCHDTPESGSNSVLGLNLFVIWTWRFHNFVASELSRINPCWSDDRLFFTARDIVIAYYMQMFYYELSPTLLGYENLLRDGVLSPFKDFRDFYKEDLLPQISIEYPVVLRWAHTITEGVLKMYDAKGNYLNETKIVDLTLRTGYLVENLEFITHGAYRQPAAKNDGIVDPDISEKGLGPHQRASDLPTSDMCKNRYFGLAPYIKYRKLCSGVDYRSFDDLIEVMDPERIEILKELYEHVEDIDLMAGIYSERYVQGGHVPLTLYCVVVEQMMRTMMSDRHWYERPNRPNAFTRNQLLQIRKASVAQMLCLVGDGVTHIQPHAFSMPGPGNEMCSCKMIEKINFWAWKDTSCGLSNA